MFQVILVHVKFGQHIIISLFIHVKYGYGQFRFVHVIIKISQLKFEIIQPISIHKNIEHQKEVQPGLVEKEKLATQVVQAKSAKTQVIITLEFAGNSRLGTKLTI